MIKLTRVPSSAENAPKIFVVAGGPGLSSLTMRHLDLLSRSFEMIYLDFQGTNGSPYLGKKSFAELSSMISDIIKIESGRKYILGHSFGGLFASDVFLLGGIAGLVCISTPFLAASLLAANENYTANKTPELVEAEILWSQNQDDASFAKWLSEYGNLYFKNPEGRRTLLNDKVSATFFNDNRSDLLDKETTLRALGNNKDIKVFICGKEDKLLPSEIFKVDAQMGSFNFYEIEDASHFATIDQPNIVAKIIETELLKSQGEKI
jgi:pimeloyl-ACP methyl ester carboxylesterase